MIRLSDYVAQLLVENGITDMFLVTGGGAMHLNDAFGRRKGLTCTPLHHEQACSMAAESYFRMTGRMAAVNVTTGPGGTNAITGVYGAYVDSLAMIVISGQVKWETLVRSTGLPLRQLGDQEVDITQMVASITKYAVMVTDPQTIRYHVERALHLARSGRPGPVWLDIPMNVQGAQIDPAQLKGYDPAEDRIATPKDALATACRALLARLKDAKRPVILAGNGVRICGAYEKFLSLVDRLGIPVTTAWNAHDLIPDAHPLYAGRPGTIGDRAGNFAVQNSDFLLVLGSRLNIRQVSYAWEYFARAAYKVIVDIDAAELKKPTVKPDLAIHASLPDFFDVMLAAKTEAPTPAHRAYVTWCHERRERYPVVLPKYWDVKDAVNPYCFVSALFDQLKENTPVVTGDGTACVATFQAARIRTGQRLYTNSGAASMGYDLPAAIGACIGLGKAPLVCLTGDGSLQMNLQELQSIVHYRLPITLFVLNNRGYHSIRQTQRNYFPDNIVGCGEESGLSFPKLERLAEAYGLPYRKIANHSELNDQIRAALSEVGPKIVEVILDLNQDFSPKLASKKLASGKMVSSPLEDLAPFLSREELQSNMFIPLIEPL